eukprot:jgi/Chrzof1/11496/UNPLg00428.t1
MWPPLLKTYMPVAPNGERRSIRVLDLFCGAGGCAMGYYRAGINVEIVGVDKCPQPYYPFTFRQMDAEDITVEFMQQFDFIHASPPCLGFSAIIPAHIREKYKDKWADRHKNYIPIIRDRLIASGKPFVIENVMGAKAELPSGKYSVGDTTVQLKAIMLCGTMFDLSVFRHRLFLSNIPLQVPMRCDHANKALGSHSSHYCQVLRRLREAGGADSKPMGRQPLAKVALPCTFAALSAGFAPAVPSRSAETLVAECEIDWELFTEDVRFRQTGASKGHKDVYYIHKETKKRFRSVKEVQRFLGHLVAAADRQPETSANSDEAAPENDCCDEGASQQVQD